MLRVALIATLMLGTAPREGAGATIFVTSLAQKTSSTGGCSLQEAIYSSTLQTNEAIDSTPPDHFIPTQCVPGTGSAAPAAPPEQEVLFDQARGVGRVRPLVPADTWPGV
jgi:hypothetical protein